MYTLFIDTHFDDVVIILYKDDDIVEKEIRTSNYHHSQIVMPLIREILSNNKINTKDLKQILVVNGPGSFTGVRIAVTIAKTLAYTLNIPIKTIDSLLLGAISIDISDNAYIAIKEKNGVYLGGFDKDYNIIKEYEYINYDEYNSFKKDNNVLEDIDIDYNKVITYSKKINSINAHLVNPLYIKRIGVNK